MESYYRREKYNVKREIRHDFIMAEVNTRYIFRKEKQSFPHPWEYYPELFAEDKDMYENMLEQQEREENRQRRMKYVEEFNKRRRQGM